MRNRLSADKANKANKANKRQISTVLHFLDNFPQQPNGDPASHDRYAVQLRVIH